MRCGGLALLALMVAAPLRIGAAELSARLDAAARELVIEVLASEPGEHELRILTPGLSAIETGADVGEPGIIYLPPPSGPVRLDQKIAIDGAENFFFFNTLGPTREWELVTRFPAEARGTWKLNGRFSSRGGDIAQAIAIPVDELEAGENLLHVRHERPPRPQFYFRHKLNARAATVRVPLMTTAWRGDVRLVRVGPAGEAAEIARADVASDAPARREISVPERWWDDRARVREAALAAGRNVLAAQVRNPRSLFDGGFHLVYDTMHESHRMAHWLWAWGPAIAFLLELEKQPGVDAEQRAQLRAAAIAAGRRSLAYGMTEHGHPAAGVSTVRWEPSRAVPGGWVEYISTADSLFLAGWGWMPLYKATGDEEFLRRTQTLVSAAARLMAQYPVVPQDWVVQRARWTPHTLDESVFGMIGFRTLHAATKAADVAVSGRRFLDSHLKHMGREDGLLERAWLRDEDKAIWDPDIKGHAWVVEGYLDAHALSGDAKYLDLARQLAARVLACQGDDGAWAYLFKKPKAGEPRDDKGTAIWACMLYQLYRKTGDAAHRDAARRAAGWCLRHQYRGEHAELDGGILNTNSMAYVRRRPMTILYSTTFFGLALLEELSLAQRE